MLWAALDQAPRSRRHQSAADPHRADARSAKPERKKKHHLIRALYRRRYLVECFFHNLKRFRVIATRYDKTARNYLALVQLACARLWLEN